MNALIFLVPVALALGLIMTGCAAFLLKRGHEDMEGAALRVLGNDDL